MFNFGERGVGRISFFNFNFNLAPFHSRVISIKMTVFKTFLAAMMGMRNQARLLIFRIGAIWVIR